MNLAFLLLLYSWNIAAQNTQDIFTFYKKVEGIDCYAFSYQNLDEKKPLLVLVHGSPGKHSDWDKYLIDKDLQQKYRVIAIDRLGFGQSGKRQSYSDLKLQAKVIHRFIKAYRNEEKVYLMGHSVGGPITARCVIDYPEDASKLILLAPAIAAEFEQPRWYNKLASKKIIQKFLPEDMLISQGEMMVLPAQLDEMKPLLANIKIPVYLFHGKKDMIAPYGNALYLENILGENLVFFKNYKWENHFIHMTQKENIKALLLDL